MATACMVISLAACIVFVSVMVLAAVIDLNTLRIPNSLIAVACIVWVVEHVALLVISGLSASAWEVLTSSASGGLSTSLSKVIAGMLAFTSGFGSHAPTIGAALAGALVLGGGSLVVSMVYERVSGKPSMGGGDIKLLFVAGLYLGWWRGFFCVMIACIAFLVISAMLTRIGWRPQVYVAEAEPSGDEAAENSAPHDDDEEEPFGFPFAPAIAIGALVALVLP